MANDLVTLFSKNLAIQNTAINSLPNEMLRTVLDKMDMMELIGCRGVSKKWMAVIEDICREKRSIIIETRNDSANISGITLRFNGLVDFRKNWTVLKLKPIDGPFSTISLSKDVSALIAKLFPQVVHIVFGAHLDDNSIENLFFLLNQWSSTIVTLYLQPSNFYRHRVALSDVFDKLTSLKRLEIERIDLLKRTTLSRLEHCSLDMEIIPEVVPYLGPSCTSLFLFYPLFASLSELPKLNAPLVKGLTHLSLLGRNEVLEVLSFISFNFTALQLLYIDYWRIQIFTVDMFSHLARLSNLSQLSIGHFEIDLPTFAKSNLPSLNSVQMLTISDFGPRGNDSQFDGDQFCSVLSVIFPNLQQLTVNHRVPHVCDGIIRNLGRFGHLRKHAIGSDN